MAQGRSERARGKRQATRGRDARACTAPRLKERGREGGRGLAMRPACQARTIASRSVRLPPASIRRLSSSTLPSCAALSIAPFAGITPAPVVRRGSGRPPSAHASTAARACRTARGQSWDAQRGISSASALCGEAVRGQEGGDGDDGAASAATTSSLLVFESSRAGGSTGSAHLVN